MSNELIEAMAENLNAQMEAQADDTTPSSLQRQKGLVWLEGWFDLDAAYSVLREKLVPVPWEPTEEQWGGLARAIVMWMDFEPKTPRVLFRHLEASGHEIPQWLRDEPEMQHLDHVPSKGTRAVIIYKAMLDAYHLPEITNAD